jgi:UDP-3-O-[3-hydroxymyristoyl] glucosamine N-acyltransferase
MSWTLLEVARLVGGRLAGRADLVVDGMASPQFAGPRQLTMIVAPQHMTRLAASAAAAAIVPEGVDAAGRDVIHHAAPYVALAKALETMYPPEPFAPGVHAAAFVHDTARLGEGVRVGPHAIVQRHAVLGDGVRIGAGAYVGRNVKVGAGSVIYPHAALYERVTIGANCIVHAGAVIGADGFGFTRDEGRHRKIPQVGGVVLGDEVEVGANSCIDAGTMEPTRIGSGTKIDNLVQVGHNCEVGERVILCGGVCIAGSAKIENDVTLAGQAGVAGHITVGANATVAAGSGVISDVDPRSVVAGFPQVAMDEWRKTQAALRRLPDLLHEVRELRRRIDELERGRD